MPQSIMLIGFHSETPVGRRRVGFTHFSLPRSLKAEYRGEFKWTAGIFKRGKFHRIVLCFVFENKSDLLPELWERGV